MSITWGVLAQSPEPEAHDKVLGNNPDRIGIWKCWFLRRGENRSTQSNDKNQQQTNTYLYFFFEQETSSGDQSIINLSLRSKLKQLRFIGRMIGFAVCQDLLLNLQLSKPFVKQVWSCVLVEVLFVVPC